jgi:hypothetical protein
MTEEKKPDCVLSDGRKIFIDLSKVSIQEWRDMFDSKQKVEAGDLVQSRVAGLTLEELHALNVNDWKLLNKTMFDVFKQPLANPT